MDLGILLVSSIILLAASLIKTNQTSKAEEERIDMAHLSLMEEINELKRKVQNLELDGEILLTEAGLNLSLHELIQKREALDLYKRAYSLENIAEKLHLTEDEVKEMLAPYMKDDLKGGTVAREN